MMKAVLIVSVLLTGAALAAQSPSSQDPSATIAAANAVLVRDPANRDAAESKISALLTQQQFTGALAAYDTYVAALHKPDVSLLAIIARADLTRLARPGPDRQVLVASALERLARDGQADALRALKQAAASDPSSARDALAPVLSLVRLGDKDATTRLGAALDAVASDQRAEIIGAIQDAGATSLGPKLVQRLRDADPPVRTAAAIAVGILQIKGAVPGLQTMFDTDAPAQKMFAAVALKQLGQTSPDAYLATLLASPVPDLRLIAARAYLSAKSPQWDTLVRALLSDRNEVNRIHAAEVMACCDKNAARATLVTVLGSANPAVRMEAARVLEDKDLADVGVARRLLGDPFDGVRLHGAGAVLKLLKTSAAPGRGGVGTVGPRG